MINLEHAKAIKGWMSGAELRWLAEQATQSRTIVEFGSWQGRSTRALADHCPGVVYAVDPWNGDYPMEGGGVHRTLRTDVFAKFAENLRDHIETGRVVPIPLPSGRARRLLRSKLHLDPPTFTEDVPLGGGPPVCLPSGPRGADLVFVDGDHRYETVVADIDLALSLVRPGGIVAGHDYSHRDWPGVKRAVDERFPKLGGLVDSLWWVRCA